MGGYAPLQRRWRNYDCRSAWYDLGINFIGYSHYFDKPFRPDKAVTWVAFTLKIGATALSTYGVVKSCGDQYAALTDESNPNYHWFENFNFLAQEIEKVAHPIVGNSYTTVQTVSTVLIMGLDIYSIYASGGSLYYYFFTGESIGAFLTTLFVSADAWAPGSIIVPTDPWDLYKCQKDGCSPAITA